MPNDFNDRSQSPTCCFKPPILELCPHAPEVCDCLTVDVRVLMDHQPLQRDVMRYRNAPHEGSS